MKIEADAVFVVAHAPHFHAPQNHTDSFWGDIGDTVQFVRTKFPGMPIFLLLDVSDRAGSVGSRAVGKCEKTQRTRTAPSSGCCSRQIP